MCFVMNSIVSDIPTLTLVVSPLISLMEHQKDALEKWNFKCIRIGSDITDEEMKGMNYVLKAGYALSESHNV